jgi:hypothetical protein
MDMRFTAQLNDKERFLKQYIFINKHFLKYEIVFVHRKSTGNKKMI